ncbi:MAG: hypothetical protein H6R36_60, partial [Chloroflexi bacterium]|nr:hypothetical protein [Chloroflexota bacterium]
LIGLLVVVCLAVIAIPAFVVVPVPIQPHPERDVFQRSIPRDGAPIWMRLSPFGEHAAGWRGVLSATASWVYLYLMSALLLVLFPRRMRLVTQTVRSGGWRVQLRLFLIGFLATLASGLLVMLARYASVWFVLVIILSGAVFVLSFLGLIGISLMVGGAMRRWAKFTPSPWIELALGSLVLFAVGRIPVAGWFCFAIVAAWGLGAVLATHLGSGEAWSLHDWRTEG